MQIGKPAINAPFINQQLPRKGYIIVITQFPSNLSNQFVKYDGCGYSNSNEKDSFTGHRVTQSEAISSSQFVKYNACEQTKLLFPPGHKLF